MSAPAPGWHADPAGADATYRWWDGEHWTRWLSRDAAAPDPTGPPPLTAVATAEAAAAAADGAAAKSPPAPPSESLVRMPLAVAIVVGTLLAAVVAVGAVASASTRGLPTGPAVAPPAPTPRRQVSYNPGLREVSVGNLRLTLAGAPYSCANTADQALPSFQSVVVCNAPVHENYDGDADWSATTGAGVLPSSLVVPGDVKATGDKAFGSIRRQFFSDTTTTVTKLIAQTTDLAPAGKAIVVSGEVHYKVSGVASRYDRLLLVVVALPDDTYGIVFSSRPNDSAKDVLDALNASLDTVTAK